MFWTIALAATDGAGSSVAQLEYDRLIMMPVSKFYELRHNTALFADKMAKIRRNN